MTTGPDDEEWVDLKPYVQWMVSEALKLEDPVEFRAWATIMSAIVGGETEEVMQTIERDLDLNEWINRVH